VLVRLVTQRFELPPNGPDLDELKYSDKPSAEMHGPPSDAEVLIELRLTAAPHELLRVARVTRHRS
jgi:hypothetical protein